MKERLNNLGLVSVSFRRYSPREILEATQSAGLSCIEWGSDIHAPCTDNQRLYEISKMQNEYGIKCSSYGTYFYLTETPLDELEKYIQAAKILGTDIIRLWCGRKTGDSMTDEEWNNLLTLSLKAAKIAKANDVKLCLECHIKTFTENLSDAIWLMESVNSPNFRMYWQPFQNQPVDRNLEYAKKISSYVEHIHVFNWREDEKLSLKKLPLADAVSEWQSYLNEIHTPRTLLLEFMPNGTIEELAKEADALRTIIGGK